MIGVYILRHPVSGVWYIGSSVNINSRILQHLNKLAKGNHENETLQVVFKESKYFDVEKITLNTIEEAKVFEKELIQKHQLDPNLANCVNVEEWHEQWRKKIQCYWTPERRKQHSLLQTDLWTAERRKNMSEAKCGVIHSDETRLKMSNTRKGKAVSTATLLAASKKLKKPVIVEGIKYESMKAVTIAFGITKEAVLRRIKSNRPKWLNWLRFEVNT